MKLNLLLHDDWEIYGDGTGNPESLMFDPACRILDICDRFGAKYTFYAEIGQQLTMLDANVKKWREYASKWERILRDAVKRGHDVQLHFHPQWIGARLKEGEWKLDYSRWNAGRVEKDVLAEWIGRGKRYLEGLLQDCASDFSVCSYRAGGWMCQPSGGLYAALKENGIVCDVSVMRGRYREFSDGGWVDFSRTVSQVEPWEVDPNDFARTRHGSEVWELPVFTEVSSLPQFAYLLKKRFRPWYYLRIHRARRFHGGRGDYSPRVVKSGRQKEYYGSFGYMHYRHLSSYVKKMVQIQDREGMEGHLIFLTHSKSFLSYKNFERFLGYINKNDRVRFKTTRSYVSDYLSRVSSNTKANTISGSGWKSEGRS